MSRSSMSSTPFSPSRDQYHLSRAAGRLTKELVQPVVRDCSTTERAGERGSGEASVTDSFAFAAFSGVGSGERGERTRTTRTNPQYSEQSETSRPGGLSDRRAGTTFSAFPVGT